MAGGQNLCRPTLSEGNADDRKPKTRESGCTLSKLHKDGSTEVHIHVPLAALSYASRGEGIELLTDSAFPSRAIGTPSLPPLSSNFHGWLLIPHK